MEVQCVPIQFAFTCAICLWLMNPHQYAFCRRRYKCHQSFICIWITCIRHWDTKQILRGQQFSSLEQQKKIIYVQDFSEKLMWKSNRNSWQSLSPFNSTLPSQRAELLYLFFSIEIPHCCWWPAASAPAPRLPSYRYLWPAGDGKPPFSVLRRFDDDDDFY